MAVGRLVIGAYDGEKWISCPRGFFLPVRVLSRLFRRLFLEGLQELFDANKLTFAERISHLHDRKEFGRYLSPLRNTEWVVYSKRPFGGPEQVLSYLGGYTHRVAISNHRLVKLEDRKISFRWKDYRRENRRKIMTLDVFEFTRRFLMHALPLGLQRIRHFGFFGNRFKKRKLALCRKYLSVPPPTAEPKDTVDYRDRYEALTGISLRECPCCESGQMKTIGTWLQRTFREHRSSS
jgi:hypothetical protein